MVRAAMSWNVRSRMAESLQYLWVQKNQLSKDPDDTIRSILSNSRDLSMAGQNLSEFENGALLFLFSTIPLKNRLASQVLDLRGSGVEERISVKVHRIENVPNLRVALDLSSNRLHGPIPVGQALTSVHVVGLSDKLLEPCPDQSGKESFSSWRILDHRRAQQNRRLPRTEAPPLGPLTHLHVLDDNLSRPRRTCRPRPIAMVAG
ncbi:hypothetical protein Mp_1g20400 [Marchantia polymorpha subsp. ruderalis]|uniref:Uncharacterized protein n=2 Tax=Marchantia polymorpha TaxID=3197 RepID=A0AAF6AS98_MARPO|nr:hypothetical protein MARPO_0001s0377 [Marchantia polymorpha]BBM99318.1 hypothetical protein Mp_1g20400 [Marchantia polymorpha subsp. ruderalis]|eukprot:PTQ50400.1 hypothetical protein MARPO_0001s0377 [Marchantia polymorpha]